MLNSMENDEMSIDRLSALPDSLILHILSFLSPDVKEAAATCVLSKRWQFLWIELPRLFFLDNSWETEKIREFVSWVHRILLRRRVMYLEKFGVHFLYDESYASDVNAWVSFAVKNKVKELTLGLQSRTYFYTLPQVLYCNSSLTDLHVDRCIVAPHGTIKWKSMTEIMIADVELHEHTIQLILSSCPVLHRFILELCWGFERLDVNSESLYELKILDPDVPLLEISAPHLRSLYISFCPIGKKFQLTNIPSLVCADIEFDGLDYSVEVMNQTWDLLEKTQHAKDLTLGSYFIKVLSVLVVHGWQLPQSRRDCLTLNALRYGDDVTGILGLLESSPNLDTLVIDSCETYEESVRPWRSPRKNDLDRELLNLKTVRLFDFARLAGEPMLIVARILLKRATALEEMVIDARGNLTEFPSEFTKMSQTVLSYPRSSEKAVIVLRQ